LSSRERRLGALEQRVRLAGGRWEADDERRRVEALTNAELIAELRACAAELGEPLSATDLKYIEVLERRAGGQLPPLSGPTS
jgi:hypothetical protein